MRFIHAFKRVSHFLLSPDALPFWLGLRTLWGGEPTRDEIQAMHALSRHQDS